MARSIRQEDATTLTLDPDLRALATKTLPTLEEYLADAQRLESKLGKAERSARGE